MQSFYTITNGMLTQAEPDTALITVVTEPDEAEKTALVERLGMTRHDVDSALDPEEIPRVEFRKDSTYIIIKRPDNVSFEQHLKFDVSSAGFLLKNGRLTLILGEKTTSFSADEFAELRSVNDFVLKFFLHTAHHFWGHLKATKLVTAEIEKKLNASQENRYLLQMISLGESFTYYLNALEGNEAVLLKLQGNPEKTQFTKEEAELLDDVKIENHQCQRQTEVYSSVLSGLMDARSSVINNNVNGLLKRLTLINVVFLPLNLIASIGGMSEFGVMTKNLPWPIAYGLLLLGMAGLGWFIWHFLAHQTNGNKAPREK